MQAQMMSHEEASTNEGIASSGAYSQELKSTKESLQNAERDSKMKEKTILSLRSKVGKVKQLEFKLAEKDGSLHVSNDELKSLRVSMAQIEDNFSDSKKRIRYLEAEIEKRKISESKLFDSFLAQKSELEQATTLVDKYKHEVASIKQKMQELEEKNHQNFVAPRGEIHEDHDEGVENEDKTALVEKIEVLKRELKQALEGEEYNKKALDDLAMALKEVTTESIQTKEQLKATEVELEVVKEEAENFKKLVICTKKTCEAILSESAKETDRLKNTVERLRFEAEEAALAWNEKEKEFVNCIKKVEAENKIIVEENKKLRQSTREAEGMSLTSKVENRKLRDILKQALNEANVAKEVATLARDENYNLQDSIKEKDKALVSLAQETERLRINEAKATESVKELKRALTMGSKRDIAKDVKLLCDHNEEDRERTLSSSMSFDLNQLCKPIEDVIECPEKDDALGGPTFLDLAEKVGPNSHHRRASSCSSEDHDKLNLEEVEQLDDVELDKNSNVKRKALLRRFGDLLKRKNSASSQKDSTKDVPNQQKEIVV